MLDQVIVGAFGWWMLAAGGREREAGNGRRWSGGGRRGTGSGAGRGRVTDSNLPFQKRQLRRTVPAGCAPAGHCRVRGKIRRIQVRSVRLVRDMLSHVLSNTAGGSIDGK